MAAIDQVFERQRKKARQEANTAKQQRTEALQRRFASLGAANSGAQLKQERIASQDAEKQFQDANESINTAEIVERQRQDEIAAARDFARSEREASQGFASEQSAIARKFAANESRLGREQQAAQFEKQYGLALDQMSLAEAQHALNQKVQLGQLDLATAQQAIQEKQFADQLQLQRDSLTQQSDQFFAKLEQDGLLQTAQIQALKEQVALANEEFAHTKAQQAIENQINAATNAATLLNNLVQAGSFNPQQIADIMNSFSVTVDGNGNVVPTNVDISFFNPANVTSSITSASNPIGAAIAAGGGTGAAAAVANQSPLPPNPTNYDYFSRGLVPPGFNYGG